MLTFDAHLRRILAGMEPRFDTFTRLLDALENVGDSPEYTAPVVRLAFELMLRQASAIAPADPHSIVQHCIDLILLDQTRAEGGPIERLHFPNLGEET